MKSFTIICLSYLFLFQFSFAEQSKTNCYPQPINKYVNDFANVIDKLDTQKIKESLKRIDQQTGTEITVVTINSINDYKKTEKVFEHFATELFNNWGIGKKKRNDGILLLAAIKDRKVRIELGSGYQGVYNRLAQSVIQNDIVPYFKQNQYSRGIYQGVHGIITSVTKEVSWLEFYKWPILMLIVILILILAAISAFRSGKNGWGGALLIAIGFLLFFLIKMLISKSSSGFGGGKSSGDGASGDW
ncbi:TPM domain-containing protein [bacterium]|nr:TPM domain-containing protein [bacterium]